LFSTYNGSVISEVKSEKDLISITLSNKRYILKIRAMKKGFLELRAPVSGEMSRRIKESMDSEVFIRLYDRQGNLKYEGRGERAGLEIIEKIFSYF
jgi:tocopherol cyclase